MEPGQLLWTALRTLAVYAGVLVLLRLTGKREIGNFSPFDLLVALMLGEIVDEAIYGDVPFAQFAVAAVSIALLQYLTGWLSCRSHSLNRVLEGVPTIIVRNGKLDREALRKERMAEEAVMALLRQHEVADVRKIQSATIEPDGQLGFRHRAWAEEAQKQDLARVRQQIEECQ